MKETDTDLKCALSLLGKEFAPNELAYLALTMKVEGPFRDRLAFLLHQTYESGGFVVAREWNRIDLAVLSSNGSPICLIELKAMYTFDAFMNLAFFTNATSEDEVKARKLAEPKTSVYSLLVVTHLDGKVPACFMKPVKYSVPINNAIVHHGSAANVRTKAESAINGDLVNRQIVATGEVSGGKAFGLEVAILFWLVRNDEA